MSIKELLYQAKTIAIVGCSSKQYRTSYMIAGYLLDVGYEIIPVNPNESQVFGITCYPSVFDIPDDIRIDIVNIFRNKIYTFNMVQEIVEWSANLRNRPSIWTQLDVSTSAAKELAESSGHNYIENRCILVEHKRLF
jgi:predicted CoA-binding protein